MRRLALMMAALVIVRASAATLGDEIERQEKFRTQCKDTGRNSMQCVIKNDTSREAEICMDVVKVCKDGDHVASVCSGLLRPGDLTSKVVHDFFPKVKFFAGCMGSEFRNRTIR